MTPSPIDPILRLEQLARAAQAEGSTLSGPDRFYIDINDTFDKEDMAFIMACSPEIVLALIMVTKAAAPLLLHNYKERTADGFKEKRAAEWARLRESIAALNRVLP